MRMWLRRAELNVMLTRELQKIAGCEGSTVIAGAQIPVADFDHSNWADFTATPAPGSDENLVRAVGGGVVSTMRELYNVSGLNRVSRSPIRRAVCSGPKLAQDSSPLPSLSDLDIAVGNSLQLFLSRLVILPPRHPH